jgi:spore maturation protein CgeB
MRFVMFYHSLVSDWNHGNAHFLRGVVGELLRRGHNVTVYEPRDGWSLANLRAAAPGAEAGFRRRYPHLRSRFYDDKLDLWSATARADVVIAHEWNDPRLIRALGRLRSKGLIRCLLFHDTHHRCVSDPDAIAAGGLRLYDGVLAFGEVLRRLYLRSGMAKRAWVWHEAADVRVYRPRWRIRKVGDLVWVGNWGDQERASELREFLIRPVAELGLRACVYGVRYPADAIDELARAGIAYGGYLPNYRVPEVFARYRVTVHVPRRPYVRALPGIPTIRPFEAMACGIPLVCSPWNDCEGLFEPGRDYLVARDGQQMKRHLRRLLSSAEARRAQARRARSTILARHTCRHRVDELLGICRGLLAAQGGRE